MLGAVLLLGRHTRRRGALRRYFKTGQTVGLKINGLAGRNAATHVELVDELSALLRQMDIGGPQQVVFDRCASDLTASGFALNERGESYRCTGNDALGYEEEATVCRPRLRASPEC